MSKMAQKLQAQTAARYAAQYAKRWWREPDSVPAPKHEVILVKVLLLLSAAVGDKDFMPAKEQVEAAMLVAAVGALDGVLGSVVQGNPEQEQDVETIRRVATIGKAMVFLADRGLEEELVAANKDLARAGGILALDLTASAAAWVVAERVTGEWDAAGAEFARVILERAKPWLEYTLKRYQSTLWYIRTGVQAILDGRRNVAARFELEKRALKAVLWALDTHARDDDRAFWQAVHERYLTEVVDSDEDRQAIEAHLVQIARESLL